MIRISQRDGLSKLQEIYTADQATRNAYVKYLNKHGNNWREAVAEWLSDNPQFKEGDVFGDKQRLQEAREIIKSNIENILANKDSINTAWLLVQHMDDDVNFQKWFFTHLKEGTQEHEYLYDRISVNEKRPQKYNTQKVQ